MEGAATSREQQISILPSDFKYDKKTQNSLHPCKNMKHIAYIHSTSFYWTCHVSNKIRNKTDRVQSNSIHKIEK